MLIQLINLGDIYSIVLSWRETNVDGLICFTESLQTVIFKNSLFYSTEAAQSYGGIYWKSALFPGTCEWARMMVMTVKCGCLKQSIISPVSSFTLQGAESFSVIQRSRKAACLRPVQLWTGHHFVWLDDSDWCAWLLSGQFNCHLPGISW